jgi:hypothetical protein
LYAVAEVSEGLICGILSTYGSGYNLRVTLLRSKCTDLALVEALHTPALRALMREGPAAPIHAAARRASEIDFPNPTNVLEAAGTPAPRALRWDGPGTVIPGVAGEVLEIHSPDPDESLETEEVVLSVAEMATGDA